MRFGLKSAILGAAMTLLDTSISNAYEIKGNTLDDREEAAYHHLIEGMDKLGIPREHAPFYLATMAKESSLDSTKVNPTSQATGYFQVIPLTADHLGYTPKEMLDPEKSVDAGLRYSIENRGRFPDTELDSAAHNQGPTSLEAVLDKANISTAEEYIEFLKGKITTNTPIPWYNRFHDRTDTLTVDKMEEVIGFHEVIQGYEQGFKPKIENYEQGVRWEDEKEPPRFVIRDGEECLELTAIDDDNSYRLAEEYTSEPGKNQHRIAELNPRIIEGEPIYIPRDLLLPELQDGNYETFYLDANHETIFSLAQAYTNPDSSPFTINDVSINSKRIQRASGIKNQRDVSGTKRLFSSSGLTKGVITPPTQPRIVIPIDDTSINFDYSYVTTGSSRNPHKGYFKTREYGERGTTSKLIKILRGRGELRANLAPREIDTILYHTSEPGGNTWEDDLGGIKRKKKAHFYVNPEGTVFPIVPIEERANCAGRSMWNGVHGLDFNSINIEVYANAESDPEKPITPQQELALKNLTTYLKGEVPTLQYFLGHNQVAVSYDWVLSEWGKERDWREFVTDSYAHRQRKGDPGKDFPWSDIGLPNMYDIVDPDIASGRVVNNHERGTHRILPGQLKAEK